MPSARDLMQKADALMRSNRNLGGSATEPEIPVLTDIVIAGDATVLRHDQPPPLLRHDQPPPLLRPDEPPPVLLPGPAPATTAVEESHRLADDLAKQEAQREAEKRDLAESVYFEVLRDLDVDTSDGMRERLATQLVPVFDHMARDLVMRAEQALSDAIRDQVAAAIERRLGVPPRSHS